MKINSISSVNLFKKELMIARGLLRAVNTIDLTPPHL